MPATFSPRGAAPGRSPSPAALCTAFALLLASGAVPAGTVQAQALCPERFHMEVEGETLSLPYCSTHPIAERSEAVRRAVLSIHGVATNAETYFENMVAAAERVPGALDETLILAPQLMTARFAAGRSLGPTDIFWETSSGRFWGGLSGSLPQHPRSVSLSSFEVMDRLLAALTDPGVFPNLEIVVLAGHSGGGQFTNRYAAANAFDGGLSRERDVHVRYIVSNPSTYVYLTDERTAPNSRTRDAFRTPPAEVVGDCPRYNRYGAGLEGLEDWPYLDGAGADRIRRQYGQRDVVYLKGMNDNDPEGAALARSCEAMLQGAHRLERGIAYYNHVEELYGKAGHRHRISFVPRVGHDHAGMWASDEGLLHIFDYAVAVEEGPLSGDR